MNTTNTTDMFYTEFLYDGRTRFSFGIIGGDWATVEQARKAFRVPDSVSLVGVGEALTAQQLLENSPR